MAHWRSNKIGAVVKFYGTYKWRWLRKGNNRKHNRKYVKYLSKFRPLGIGVVIYWVKKNSDLQNPPSGPPFCSILQKV